MPLLILRPRRQQALAECLAVDVMNQRHQNIEAEVPLQLSTEQPLQPGRAMYAGGIDVVIVRAKSGRFSGQPKALFAFAQTVIRRLQSGCPLADAAFKLAVERDQLPGLAIKFNEDADLGSQQL